MTTTRRPATALREAFLPGDPVSLSEATALLGGDQRRASQALTYLRDREYFVKVRNGLWVRAGAPADPYRLAARLVTPYAFAYGTALALHGAASAMGSEILVSAPRWFDPFEHDGLRYRSVAPWSAADLVRIPAGPEFVWATSRERTFVECVRLPANVGGLTELLRGVGALSSLSGWQVLKWVDHHGEANLAGRVGFVLETTGLADSELLAELEKRRPRAPFYLEPGRRGGKLARRWNTFVPDYLRPTPAGAP